MPRRRAGEITGAPITQDASERERIQAPHQGLPADELSPDIDRVLAELGETGSAAVLYRQNDVNMQWDYVTRVPAAEFNLEKIKQEFGGGTYKLIAVDAQHGPLNPVVFSIDKRFRPKDEIALVTASARPTDDFKDKLLQILLLKVLSPAPAPVVQQAPAQSNQESLMLAVELAKLFKDDRQQPVSDPVATATAMMGSVVELAQRVNGGGDSLAGVAAQFLPVVKDMMATHQPPPRRVIVAAPRPVPPQPPRAPTPNPSPMPATPPATVVGAIVPKWLAPFRMYASQLVRMADRESPPEVVAEMVLDELTDNEDAFRATCESMNASTLEADFFAAFPAMAETDKRKAFAARLVALVADGVREMIAQDTAADEPTGTDTEGAAHG